MHFPYHSFLIAEFFVSPFDFVLNWYYNNTEKENNGDHAMTKTTKQPLQERLLQAGVEELYQHGIENFSDMVADETVTCDAEELIAWLTEKGHPVLGLDPLM